MAKRYKAKNNPALLTWARTTASYELAEAANKIDVPVEQLKAWEDGEDAPSIAQLRKLAAAYKRPLAVFYLPEPPNDFQVMHDFRRLPEFGARRFSPALAIEIRSAQQRRELAIELYEESDLVPPKFELEASLRNDPEKIGLNVREALDIRMDEQRRWGNQIIAFREWRTRIENHGVLVFQASRVDSDEASGFAFWAETFPFIVVNRKDVYPRRTFSLLHELAHLMVRQSGVSEANVDAHRSQHDAKVEIFCNHVAAAALMPRSLFLSHQSATEHPSDQQIEDLATTFSASREGVVRRLLTFGLVSENFYARKRAQYIAEFHAQRQRERERRGDQGIPRNMPIETVADMGRPFIRAVIENYHQDRITLSEVSGYLGVKVRHIPGIEAQVGMA